MLAICIPVTSWPDYEAYARVGIDRVLAAAPQTLVLAEASTSSYQATVNAMLDRLAGVPGLGGAIVIHQDVELLDASAARLATQFRGGQVAIVGAVGSTATAGLRWWMGAGRGLRVELPAPFAAMELMGGSAIVAAVDGILLALSPWAVRNLRFDERFAANFHGYDVDICLQARAHGKLVVVEEIPVRHHQVDGLRAGRDRTWLAAEVQMRRKWDVPSSPPGLAWTRGPVV